MAVLFSNESHVCPKCNRCEFEEVTIKSYHQVSEKKLKTNTATNYIRCVHCNTLELVSDFGGLQIEE